MKCEKRNRKLSVGRLLTTGAAAGLLNGLFGAGAGMVLVPLLTRWCGLKTRTACATSVAIVTPLCLISAIVFRITGGTFPKEALWYCLGGLIGGTASGLILGRIPVQWLLRLFGALMILAGLRMVCTG